MKDAVSVEVSNAFQELLHVATHQVQRQAHTVLIKQFLEVLHKYNHNY